MNIAILTSGGDSSGMNPAIKKFVEYSYEKGHIPYFIYNGLEGLIDGEIKKAEYKDVSGIIYRGGTIIRSSRSRRWFEASYRKLAFNNLIRHNIDALVILGGDGSFKAIKKFHDEYGFRFMAVPATIDNDLAFNDYTIGTDTALNVIRQAIDEIRDTASSFPRAFVIETMGRECGYLALTSALANGAEMCLIPELRYSLQNLKKKFKKQNRKYYIAIVAEGLKITDKIKQWFENEISIESRTTVLGHIQRGGNPTVLERLKAAEFIVHAIESIGSDPNKAVLHKNGAFYLKEIEEVINTKYSLNPEMLQLAKPLMGLQ